MQKTDTRSNPVERQRVAFQPDSHQRFQAGINKLANAIRPTLGPCPRMVAIDRILDARMPELLDNGGIIAKRITQIPGWREDVGAMYLRDVLWRLHEQVGDGTATAAVLFQYVYNKGVRYLAAGGSAPQLRAALEKGVRLIVHQLTNATARIKGKAHLTRIAETVCHSPQMAMMLGEIFDVIGEYGQLEIRKSHGREFEREYVEGMYWERGVVSREMLRDSHWQKLEVENVAILISDLELSHPQQLIHALELALQRGIKTLILVANTFSDSVIGFLLANKKPEKFQVIAVRTPGAAKLEQAESLEDMAVLTGGIPLVKAAGDTFEMISATHFGYARRAWADTHNFGIVGGKGNPRMLRQHIADLRTVYSTSLDIVIRERLLQRIGKLLGGSATFWVGGTSEVQIEQRVEIAKRTAAAVRSAMMDGEVPGGGLALLATCPALQNQIDRSTDADERAAFRILKDAMAEPLRTIICNAGHNDHQAFAQLADAGDGHAFDARTGKVLPVEEFGIYDSAATQKAAVYIGISSAALALSIDVLVHRNIDSGLQPIQGPGQRKSL